MKRILVAVITEGEITLAPFCFSLVQSVKTGLTNEIEFFPVFFQSEGNWSMSFNRGVTTTWEEKLDGFVCISPRVAWDAECLIDLVNSDKDAVAVPVATKNGFALSLGEIARLQEDENTGEIKVNSASLDFIYLSSHAVNRLCETHPTVKYRGAEVKLILQSGDIYNTYFDPSEILNYRLREQGIETWVATKHTAHRQDYAEYQNNFATILKQLKENG